ncbi:MAG: putative glycoside hydrolase [Patescibacteria group bacterium]|jgi:hypothetical protein
MFRFFYKFFAFFILFFFGFLLPTKSQAFVGRAQDTYPKLANYYLRWEIPDTDVNDLSKWDLLILDMEVQHNSLNNLRRLRQLNPNILVASYITSEEIKTDLWDSRYSELRSKILPQVNNWWLKDPSGNRTSFWPGTYMLNVAANSSGQDWNEFLPSFVNQEILSTGLWDGVFYDNLFGDISWFNSGNLDFNNDGKRDDVTTINNAWRQGNIKILSTSVNIFGSNYLVLANANCIPSSYTQSLNGFMTESFSASAWTNSMKAYVDTNNLRQPEVMVINANMNNGWDSTNYRRLRFSFGSALLGGGYFSFDYGTENHGQTWWYDEYDTVLGKAVSAPVNILDKNNKDWKKGVWRRDFENGIVVVNSTDQNQNYVFSNEAFSKISGSQDRVINNGSRVNMVSVMGQDAIVLLGNLSERKLPSAAPVVAPASTPSSASFVIKNSAFTNGAFYRVFNSSGSQKQSGFFSYSDKYPAGSQVIATDIDNGGHEEILVNYNGVISVYRNGILLRSFKPFDEKFKGDVSLAVADLNGDATKEIIVGAGTGGGPQVRVFDGNGKPLTGGFFAYDRAFRGGVNIAVMDLNGDGTKEIITGAGNGGGPHVRIFSKDGKELGGFFAYDKNLRSGAVVTVGNVDGIGDKEIITATRNSSEIRIFDKTGKLLNRFNAYESAVSGGMKISTADIDNDGTEEILTGNVNF